MAAIVVIVAIAIITATATLESHPTNTSNALVMPQLALAATPPARRSPIHSTSEARRGEARRVTASSSAATRLRCLRTTPVPFPTRKSPQLTGPVPQAEVCLSVCLSPPPAPFPADRVQRVLFQPAAAAPEAPNEQSRTSFFSLYLIHPQIKALSRASRVSHSFPFNWRIFADRPSEDERIAGLCFACA